MGTIRTGIVALMAFSLVGCAGLTPPFEKNAFGPQKTYAVVSIYSAPYIEGSEVETVEGAVRVLKGEGAYAATSENVLEASAPRIVSVLDQSPHFQLMDATTVLNSSSYRRVEADPLAKLGTQYRVASGYKYLWNGEKLGALATSLGVDGVIVVSIDFRYRFYGQKTGVLGVGATAEGTTSPDITMTVAFYGPDGTYVWKHQERKILREGVASVGEAADFENLEPLLVKAAGMVVESINGSLARRMK